MTIGFGMLNPVLNEPRNQWYAKHNHVRIPKRAESKQYLDAFFTGEVVSEPPPPPPPNDPEPPKKYAQPYPWEGFHTHAAINDWVEEEDLLVPTVWFQWTIANKKSYLAQEYGL